MVQKASRTGHFERFFGHAWNESENLTEENFKIRLDRALETQDTDTSRLLLAALGAERIAADELYSPNTKQKIHAAIQTSRKALINEAIGIQRTNQTPRTETTPPEGSI
jgi:hypothetical protein